MLRCLSPILLLSTLAACTAPFQEPEPGIGEPVPWERLEGWRSDNHAKAWPALLASCRKLRAEPAWRDICRDAARLDDPGDAEARAFVEDRLQPHPVIGDGGDRDGLITGYYEPLLHGSRQRSERYRFPLYERPGDLLRIELDGAYPELGERQLRGRLQGNTVVPYPARAELAASPELLAGSELLWVDDPVDAFFLQVQGSGRVMLPDGRIVAVRFADHNGRPYRSIGRRLIRSGELERDAVNLFSIRRWLRNHPDRMQALFNHNPRFVFFRLDNEPARGPTGALNVPLTPGRSLAVDRERIPLGAPVWLSTTMPGQPDERLERLMMAQDTGGAIKGWTRADVFWGQGEAAERRAGLMKETGRMFVLLPRPAEPGH